MNSRLVFEQQIRVLGIGPELPYDRDFRVLLLEIENLEHQDEGKKRFINFGTFKVRQPIKHSL